MSQSTENWSFSERDFNTFTQSLQRYLDESGCSCVLLVDRSGQLVTMVGERAGFEPMSFASLTAADFSANDQLARLLGEKEFTTLFHQGEKESMYMAAVADRLILVALFDRTTTPGLVRMRTGQEVEELSRILAAMAADPARSTSPAQGLLAGAEDEIDRLFK